MKQYALVRESKLCILCLKDKSIGLLLCTECENKEKERYGGKYGPITAGQLEGYNTTLLIEKQHYKDQVS